MLDIAVMAVTGASALVYGIWGCHQPASWWRSFVKTLAVAGLCLIAFLAGGPILLVVGLAFCALGDLLLSRETDSGFLAGMAAFFAGHMAYVALFFASGEGWALIGARWPVAVIFLAYAALFYRYLYPGLGQFRVPVAAYSGAIALMGVAALTQPVTLAGIVVLVGALSFIISDSVLAIDKFRLPPNSGFHRAAPYLVWATYWAAQALIVYGVIAA